MRREYLDHATRGVFCRATRPFPREKAENKVHVFCRQGNAAFPVSPNIRRPSGKKDKDKDEL